MERRGKIGIATHGIEETTPYLGTILTSINKHIPKSVSVGPSPHRFGGS
jgi:hypothetical protein